MTDALVIGAGWSGLAAAVGLVEAGIPTLVIDAAHHAGGRARRQILRLGPDVTVEVDNGQHLLIGAYRSTLELLERIGVKPSEVVERTPLTLRDPQGLAFQVSRLPAPLHLAAGLLRARGLRLGDRWAMVRVMTLLARGGADRIRPGTTVERWLHDCTQPPALTARLWEPLCIGALNTPTTHACAQTFARVLHDALLGVSGDSDFLLPRRTLGDLVPEPAVQWLRSKGTQLRWGCACRSLTRTDDGRWLAQTDRGPIQATRVIVALPPTQVPRILKAALPTTLLQCFDRFEHEAIATVWLAWAEKLNLPEVSLLTEQPDSPGQWLFRRSPGTGHAIQTLAGVVISAAGRRTASPVELGNQVVSQLKRQLDIPSPAAVRAVIERRATIRCTPDRPRIDTDALRVAAPGIVLAGDWIWHSYPATLESAVRAGNAAARFLTSGEAVRASSN